MARKNIFKTKLIFLIAGIFLGGIITTYIIPIKAVKNCDEAYEMGYLQGTKDWIKNVSKYNVTVVNRTDTVYMKKVLP